jgi:hypothetical protein
MTRRPPLAGELLEPLREAVKRRGYGDDCRFSASSATADDDLESRRSVVMIC